MFGVNIACYVPATVALSVNILTWFSSSATRRESLGRCSSGVHAIPQRGQMALMWVLSLIGGRRAARDGG